VTRGKEAQQARLANLQEEHKRLTADRERIIREAVEADPTYVPKDEGFIARLRALRQLMGDPEIAIIVALFDLAFFGIELAAVLSKILTKVPSTYAVMLASEEHLSAFHAAKELARAIKSGKEPPQAAAPIMPPLPPRAPGPAGAMAMPLPRRADEKEPADVIGKGEIAVEERLAEPAARAPAPKAASSSTTTPRLAVDRRASGASPVRRKRGRPPGPAWRPEIIPPQGGPAETAAAETVRSESLGDDKSRESQDETGRQNPIGAIREPDDTDRQG
jgi:hypothetical protein